MDNSKSRLVRLAYTNDKVRFTPRGGVNEFGEQKGFIRRNGRTISGAVTSFNSAFYATGQNEPAAYGEPVVAAQPPVLAV